MKSGRIIILLIAIAIMTGLCLVGFDILDSKSYDKKKVNGEIVSLDKMEDIENDKNGYYYFGRPDCIECRDFQKELDSYLENNNILVKYINTNYFKSNFNSFQDFLQEESITEIPIIIYYYDNVEVNRIDDMEDISSILQ